MQILLLSWAGLQIQTNENNKGIPNIRHDGIQPNENNKEIPNVRQKYSNTVQTSVILGLPYHFK